MTGEVLEKLTDPEGQHAAARSRVYAAFAEIFEYPDAEYFEAVRSGTLAEALREVLRNVDPSLAEEGEKGGWQALTQAGDDKDDLAVEFTRLFDVGASGPPCPLYGGLYGGARMKTMEEVVRFYNHFGLTLSESPHELPDHLTTELEFLHFLAFREAQTLEKGEDAGPYRRAQRDFLARHLGRWIPKMRAKLEGESPMPFFLALVHRLESFLLFDGAHLVAVAGAAPPPSATPDPARKSKPH
jgi:DMSO reductase family type II enzyme chaperone